MRGAVPWLKMTRATALFEISQLLPRQHRPPAKAAMPGHKHPVTEYKGLYSLIHPEAIKNLVFI